MGIDYNEMQTENTFTLYWKEVNWIAKNLGLDVNKFKIDDITFGGEPCIFYKDEYYGYLDNLFYECYDNDDFDSWWDFDSYEE